MAKFYNPQGTYGDCCQALLIGHCDPHPGSPPLGFHIIALWNNFHFNPWDLIALVRWDPLHQLPWGTTTPEQLGLAKILISMPELISASCTYCRQTIKHPWKLQWNISRGACGQRVVPACAYDPTYWPAIWTPDYWPPVFV